MADGRILLSQFPLLSLVIHNPCFTPAMHATKCNVRGVICIELRCVSSPEYFCSYNFITSRGQRATAVLFLYRSICNTGKTVRWESWFLKHTWVMGGKPDRQTPLLAMRNDLALFCRFTNVLNCMYLLILVLRRYNFQGDCLLYSHPGPGGPTLNQTDGAGGALLGCFWPWCHRSLLYTAEQRI